jgi:hypothetical protein
MTVDITLDAFLAKVNKRNTNPDGSVIDPYLLDRMDNPICQDCHAQYKLKYPGKPFNIKCNGVYGEDDYLRTQQNMKAAVPDEDPLPIEDLNGNDIREVFDIAYWANKYINTKDDNGEFAPFVARPYQETILKCTANLKVDRLGRGLGKTTIAKIEEIHKVFTTKNYDDLIICPADSQSDGWYNGIIELIDTSTGLQGSISDKKQNPFRKITFKNEAEIRIFTAGSSSGRKASSIRSQSPRRVRIDEQDYLVEEDWGAISPLLTRYKNSEFHGSSTPTGDRSKFWHMCTQDDRYREFYYPISVHPDWDDEMEVNCRTEALTEDRYRHEYLAEFGDPSQGVFKNIFIDQAKVRYSDPFREKLRGYATCVYDGSKEYFMGIDWNGEGTGTRIRVVEYDNVTKITRCVAKHTVDFKGFTNQDSINAVVRYNSLWHCTKVFIDHGYGATQLDDLKLIGLNSNDPDTKRLVNVVSIDFGANLEFNNIISSRAKSGSRYIEKEEVKRRTKPFMVEGAVMRFELQTIKFSDDDTVLDSQLRGYRVKNYSQDGFANTYTTEGGVGDHDLDAFMLALLAVEMTHGLYATPDSYRRHLATISHAGSWGVALTPSATPKSAPEVLEEKKVASGIARRMPKAEAQDEYRILYLTRGGATIAANPRANVPSYSRTSIFKSDKPRGKRWGM